MHGYKMTFGLIAVDRATQKRTVKPSARWLGKMLDRKKIMPNGKVAPLKQTTTAHGTHP
jgi:beta-glucosidase/6-phospho-beta-glucosidase/beta-galactosidase